MKPTVWHVIGDKRAGGSNRLVQQLVTSSLNEQFDFEVLRLETAKEKLKSSSPQGIIFHYPCAWKYLDDLWLLKQKSQLYIYDHHYSQGFEQHQVASLCRFRLMLKLAYGLADGVISISHAQRDWMVSNKLVKPSKIKTIFSASPVDALLTIAAKSPSNPLKIGAYGRFAPQKGFDLLLPAFASLPADKFQLYLGGYGQDEQLIEDLAKDLPHVKLIGAIEDVPAFLADCDVIVIPSRWEPWGLVCLEAKAAGKPVIVFDVDGLKEQVQNCGLLVPGDDSDKLTKAIASLPGQDLAAWGEAGRASVVNAWSEFLHSWSLFLEEITG
ncbi:glycosyltransferase family 4 protein [Waterburya agarophytonicola K14]|uniref:Glycosyltransferase family 4 protein n=1 Tax=Waterburya agarophytonicola KI4 TaxID=2874699 RepID=A0A964BXW7_9CYAN|nr:glycosyltransferase family 4 protein [Waterburya agarophytonicola]MCC0179240.1 glycosyltransferase family 4 protein [Waterburya agarophytonicola KI4]